MKLRTKNFPIKMITQQELHANVDRVREQIVSAAEKAGRDPDEITLVAVTKTVPAALIIEAYQLGIRNFGENYLQEALLKMSSINQPDIIWHMIGHLQTNKVNKVVPNFQYIHTVDSLKLVCKLDEHAGRAGKIAKILLQVNISGEESKNGMTEEETITVAKEIGKLKYISAVGLMTIPPFSHSPEESRPVFTSLRLLKDRLQKEVPQSNWEQLSMGMSHDFRIAIEEGATMVRVGQALFGKREKNRHRIF
jgi:PLP dependent protein